VVIKENIMPGMGYGTKKGGKKGGTKKK